MITFDFIKGEENNLFQYSFRVLFLILLFIKLHEMKVKISFVIYAEPFHALNINYLLEQSPHIGLWSNLTVPHHVCVSFYLSSASRAQCLASPLSSSTRECFSHCLAPLSHSLWVAAAESVGVCCTSEAVGFAVGIAVGFAVVVGVCLWMLRAVVAAFFLAFKFYLL